MKKYTVINVLFSSDSMHHAVLTMHRELSILLEAQQYRVINIFLTGPPGGVAGYPGENRFWQCEPKLVRGKGLCNFLPRKKLIRRFRNFIQDEGAELVLCDGKSAIRLLAGVQQHCCVKGIGIFHGTTRFGRADSRRLRTCFLRWKFTAVSDMLKRQLIRDNAFFPVNGIEVIPNALNFDALKMQLYERQKARQLLSLEQDAFVFGCTGRLSRVKMHSTLISAARLLHKKPLSVRAGTIKIIIIGSGVLEERLKRQAAEAGCGDIVIFAGSRPEAFRYLKAFDAFVMPSAEKEAFGLALLEACAAGLPVITSDIEAFRAIAGEGGCRFTPGDAESLAVQMHHVLKMSAEQRALQADQSRQYARSGHDIEQYRQSYLQLITDSVEF